VKNALIRTKVEIESIKKACEITDLAFEYALLETKEGISEKQLAKKISSYIRKRSQGLAFKTIVAFKENSTHVHHKPTSRKLKKGDNILFDFGARVNGFCSDLSRTIFFGKADKNFKKAYKTVLNTQEKSIKFVNLRLLKTKKIRCKKVDSIARDYLISKGYPSIPHGLGHSVGKKIHQAPRFSPKSKHFLKENMVITVEPGVYLNDFGIRIEDTILIGKIHTESLTRSSRKLIELQ
jgi:Xaa-Pro aminopeptidase